MSRDLSSVAILPCSTTRRDCAFDRQRISQIERSAWRSGLSRNGQDSYRRTGRSSGSDRHRGLFRRSRTTVVWTLDALRACASPHVRTVASAWNNRNHYRIQFPVRSLGVERACRRSLWRYVPLEAKSFHTARRDCNQ